MCQLLLTQATLGELGVEFISKLDWSHPLTYLTILGALGAPAVIWRVAKWLGGLLYPWWLRIWERGLNTDFFYTYREVAYRIPEGEDGEYLYIRKERVTSNTANLPNVPIQYRWTCEGEFEEAVEPGTYTLADAPRIPAQGTRRRKQVIFQPPLRKGSKAFYTLIAKCTKRAGEPEPLLALSSPRRVDQMVLRVMFPLDRVPNRVFYRVLDSDGREIHREQIMEYDRLTGEFQKRVKRAKPFVTHQIEWQ